jgi:hypothetical protein
MACWRYWRRSTYGWRGFTFEGEMSSERERVGRRESELGREKKEKERKKGGKFKEMVGAQEEEKK